MQGCVTGISLSTFQLRRWPLSLPIQNSLYVALFPVNNLADAPLNLTSCTPHKSVALCSNSSTTSPELPLRLPTFKLPTLKQCSSWMRVKRYLHLTSSLSCATPSPNLMDMPPIWQTGDQYLAFLDLTSFGEYWIKNHIGRIGQTVDFPNTIPHSHVWAQRVVLSNNCNKGCAYYRRDAIYQKSVIC